MSEQLVGQRKDFKRQTKEWTPLFVEPSEKLNVIEKAKNMRDNSAIKLGKELHPHNSKFRAEWYGDI